MEVTIKKFDSVKKMKKATAKPGDLAIVNNKMYTYSNSLEGWTSWNPTGEQINLKQDAYSMAKTLAAQATTLTAEEIIAKKDLIKNYLQNHNNNKYFMLLLKDMSYYTLFVSDENNEENASDIIIECLSCLGTIVDLDEDDNGAIEIWIKDMSEEAHIGYFFPYDEGVIECRLS